MNTNKEYFLHNAKQGCTTSFCDQGNGLVLVRWQQTRDPNEELNEEHYKKGEAREMWRQYIREGATKAHGWHTCKRDSAWANNGDEYGDG
jgi:hypothetical protein